MLKYETIKNETNDWVVFIHGIGGSTKTWSKQIGDFSKKYNLLLLDLPGHGLNADKIIDKVDPKKLYKSIKETMDYLNIKSAHFIGLSIGTIVIANFAVYYPEYVKTIILGGSALKLSGIYKGSIIAANIMKKRVPYKFLYKFFAWFMMHKKNHKKSRLIFLREVVKLHKETMYAWIEYLQFALDPETILNKLDSLGKRILLISGNEDYCFLRDVKLLAKKMKNSDIKIIEKSGHICSIENWRTFNDISLEYLSLAS